MINIANYTMGLIQRLRMTGFGLASLIVGLLLLSCPLALAEEWYEVMESSGVDLYSNARMNILKNISGDATSNRRHTKKMIAAGSSQTHLAKINETFDAARESHRQNWVEPQGHTNSAIAGSLGIPKNDVSGGPRGDAPGDTHSGTAGRKNYSGSPTVDRSNSDED